MTGHGTTPPMVTLAALVAVLVLMGLIVECRQSVVAPAAATPTMAVAVDPTRPLPSPPPVFTPFVFVVSPPTSTLVVEAILTTPTTTRVLPTSTPMPTATSTSEPTRKPMSEKVERG